MLRFQSLPDLSSAAGKLRQSEPCPGRRAVCANTHRTYHLSIYFRRGQMQPVPTFDGSGAFVPCFRSMPYRRGSLTRYSDDWERAAFGCTEKGCNPDNAEPLRSLFIYRKNLFFIVVRKCTDSACLCDSRNPDKVVPLHFHFDHSQHSIYLFFNHFFIIDRVRPASVRPCDSDDSDQVVPAHFFFDGSLHILHTFPKLLIYSGEYPVSARSCESDGSTIPVYSLFSDFDYRDIYGNRSRRPTHGREKRAPERARPVRTENLPLNSGDYAGQTIHSPFGGPGQTAKSLGESLLQRGDSPPAPTFLRFQDRALPEKPDSTVFLSSGHMHGATVRKIVFSCHTQFKLDEPRAAATGVAAQFMTGASAYRQATARERRSVRQTLSPEMRSPLFLLRHSVQRNSFIFNFLRLAKSGMPGRDDPACVPLFFSGRVTLADTRPYKYDPNGGRRFHYSPLFKIRFIFITRLERPLSPVFLTETIMNRTG